MDNDNNGNGIKGALNYNSDFSLDWHDCDEGTDGYQLKWVGKTYARLLSKLKPSTIITPDIENNNKDENKSSNNLIFTGDNIEVLRHLARAYTKKVDVIYIDPPYNTGNKGDFIYDDNFDYTNDELQEMLGLSDKDITRLESIKGHSSHSAWLTFMYPRLRIARDLLKDSGVIFISIDDNEQANLKLLCDEVFGEGNFIADCVIKSKLYNKYDNKLFSKKSSISPTSFVSRHI